MKPVSNLFVAPATTMKTMIFIELERLNDEHIWFEISEGTVPNVGHFGPRTTISSAVVSNLDSALAEVVKLFALNPNLITWATKPETE